MKQPKNKHCSYERQLFTSENERCLRTLLVNGIASTSSQANSTACGLLLADICANVDHMKVRQLCSGASNATLRLTNLSIAGSGTSAKKTPSKVQRCIWESCMFCPVSIFNCAKKFGQKQMNEHTHTHTPAHAKTVAQTSSNLSQEKTAKTSFRVRRLFTWMRLFQVWGSQSSSPPSKPRNKKTPWPGSPGKSLGYPGPLCNRRAAIGPQEVNEGVGRTKSTTNSQKVSLDEK